MTRALPTCLECLQPRLLLSTVYWHHTGNGDWDRTSLNWNTAPDGAGTQVAWSDGDDAVFNTSQTATITILPGPDWIDANSLTVSASGYTFTGGELDLENHSTISA